MKAKEMFKKLGYEVEKDNDNYLLEPCISCYKYELDKATIIIHFWLDRKIYTMTGNTKITLEELQAINKQVEELGWLRGEENEQ